MVVFGFRTSAAILNLSTKPLLADVSIAHETQVEKLPSEASRRPMQLQTGSPDSEGPAGTVDQMLDESQVPTEQSSKQQVHESHQQSRLEDAPAGDLKEREEGSVSILLGLLVSFACALGGFVDGMTILHHPGSVVWIGIARLVRTSIEAYTVGHLMLHIDHIHRLKYILALYTYVLAFPSGIFLSVAFGTSLSSKTTTSLLIRWVLLSVSFGTTVYIIIFHIINRAFNSEDHKKKSFFLFVLGQAVSFGLVARPV